MAAHLDGRPGWAPRAGAQHHVVALEELEGPGAQLLSKMKHALVKKQLALPPLPRVALELQRLASDPQADAQRAVLLLEREPAMAARVLQLANSAAYNVNQPVGDIKRAVTRLGLGGVRDLALTVALGRVLRDGALSRHARAMQRHAFAVASGAQFVSRVLGLDPQQGFLCGLLHDIGRAALVAQAAQDRVEITPHELEQALEEHHNTAGAWTLRAWELPGLAVDTAQFHHEPDRAGASRPMVLAVAAVDRVEESQEDVPMLERMEKTPEIWQCGLPQQEFAGLAKVLEEARRDQVLGALAA